MQGRRRLEGRVGVITGTASGIGRAGALLFAAEGAAVVTMDTDAEGGQATLAEIETTGGRGAFLHGDVSVGADVDRSVKRAIEAFGSLDLLWANASIAVIKPLVDTSEDEWDHLMAVNVKGAFLLAKYGLPEMVRFGGGTMVVTGSISSFVGSPLSSAYCTAKGGVLMLTRAIALEYAQQGIRVNCLCPGSTDTNMVQVDLRSRDLPYEEAVLQDKAAHPLNRWARPEEIANAALFLSCDESSFMTGSALMVDGGFTAQ